MVISSPLMISLSAADEAILSARAVSARAPYHDGLRARIVLAAARGGPNAVIAAGLRIHVDTVRKWRKRYAAAGLDGLKDLPRAGRPVTFTPVQVAGVKALACTPPTEKDVPLGRWSAAELAAQVVTEGLVESISQTTVARWLAEDAIKPWQHAPGSFPATRPSAPRPPASWTSTPVNGTESPSGRTST